MVIQVKANTLQNRTKCSSVASLARPKVRTMQPRTTGLRWTEQVNGSQYTWSKSQCDGSVQNYLEKISKEKTHALKKYKKG